MGIYTMDLEIQKQLLGKGVEERWGRRGGHHSTHTCSLSAAMFCYFTEGVLQR